MLLHLTKYITISFYVTTQFSARWNKPKPDWTFKFLGPMSRLLSADAGRHVWSREWPAFRLQHFLQQGYYEC